jgi:hypothetical protein
VKHAQARFGFYLFRHELSGTDPRNPPDVRRCSSKLALAQWLEDFGHAARAARLGIK